MKTFALILFALLVISVFISYFFFKKYKKVKAEYNDILEKHKGLLEEFQKLLEVNKIKDANKEKADEKINNLHNGNAVDNAINILRK